METGNKKAITKGNLKLILTYKDEKISAELYDIENDPYETTNIVSEMPDAARAMEESLDAYLESAATNSAAKEVGMGGEVKKQLKALGYLQ
jgi:arylsulfatase A-like enzyme